MNAAEFRFRPANRLLLGKEYTAVFAHRRVLRNGSFELYYRPLPPTLAQCSDSATPAARLGLVVPKRNAKRAVQRNLIKRLAREAFRHICATLPPYDLVLRLGKPLPGAAADERKLWRTQIDELLSHLPRN